MKLQHSSDISSSVSNGKSKTRRYSNEDAQAAIIFLLVVGLVAIGALYIYLGPTMDQFTIFHNEATQGPTAFLPVSQERQDSIFILQLAYRAYPIIAFVVVIMASVIAAMKWRTGYA